MSDSGELAYLAHQLLEAGEVTAEGLDGLMAVAMRDGVVDEDEKAVLREVIARLDEAELDHEVLARLDAIRDQFGV